MFLRASHLRILHFRVAMNYDIFLKKRKIVSNLNLEILQLIINLRRSDSVLSKFLSFTENCFLLRNPKIVPVINEINVLNYTCSRLCVLHLAVFRFWNSHCLCLEENKNFLGLHLLPPSDCRGTSWCGSDPLSKVRIQIFNWQILSRGGMYVYHYRAKFSTCFPTLTTKDGNISIVSRWFPVSNAMK
jgi:hypothetical protein